MDLSPNLGSGRWNEFGNCHCSDSIHSHGPPKVTLLNHAIGMGIKGPLGCYRCQAKVQDLSRDKFLKLSAEWLNNSWKMSAGPEEPG